MFNFLKNPFAESDRKPERKSAQKELEAQKKARQDSKALGAEKSATAAKAVPPVKSASAPKKPEAKKTAPKTANLGAGFGIIIKPHVSEKTARQGTNDTYAFVVNRNANKIEIKKAFHKMYGVEPSAIQIANVAARSTYFRRVAGSRSSWKKAYIRVPRGSSVAVYEGV